MKETKGLKNYLHITVRFKMNLAFQRKGEVVNIDTLDMSKEIEEKLDCIFKIYVKSRFGNYYLFDKNPSIQMIEDYATNLRLKTSYGVYRLCRESYEKYLKKKNKEG